MTTPQSLNTQKPAAWPRPAWCSPAIGTNARRACPLISASVATSAAPTTSQAAS